MKVSEYLNMIHYWTLRPPQNSQHYTFRTSYVNG